ncbi:MAG TPA: OmpA family protein [Acetobacteraceae bacterium]|nr:OmpA family protein [Acetobacteraceae bacterium]
MSRRVLLTATFLAAPLGFTTVANAQPVTGLYIGAGANFMEQQQFRTFPAPGGPPPVFARSSFDTGVAVVGSVGWGFGNGVRVEAEGNYRYNRFSNLSGVPGASIGGHEEKAGPMLNALFDLDVGSPYIYPYIGAGVGYQWVQQRANFSNGLTRTNIKGDDSGFAYQAIAGVSLPIPWVVGLSLTAEYRYFAVAGDREFDTLVTGFGPTAVASRVKTKADFNHSLMLGLRYAFNVAPPPPPAVAVAPPPAAEAARTYLVFFDWDRADLTDRARQVIAEAAQATTRVQVTRIEVNGYTDLSGTARYNQGLSVRRAQAVANELVRLGVPRTAITARGFGESNPLVPTAKGVREPQNRRVEIILR